MASGRGLGEQKMDQVAVATRSIESSDPLQQHNDDNNKLTVLIYDGYNYSYENAIIE